MEYFKEPALFVESLDGKLDENMDLSIPPASGEEYIKRVIIEAQKCADVVVADVEKIQMRTPTVRIESLTGCIEAPEQLSPSLEWQHCQLIDFSAIRLYVSRLKDEIQMLKRPWKPQCFKLPSMNNQNGWIKFCSSTEDNKLINPPTLNLMFNLNQPTVEQMLEYLIDHIEEKRDIEYGIGQWIYALLVVLELPLNPNMCSCLRSLARICSVIRVDNNLEVHEIGALNLFICLVARYFRQLDLADP